MRRLERAGRVCASHTARSPGNSPSVNAHASRRGALKRAACRPFSVTLPTQLLSRSSASAGVACARQRGLSIIHENSPMVSGVLRERGGTAGRTGEGGSGGVKDNRMRRSACALFAVTWHSRFLSPPPNLHTLSSSPRDHGVEEGDTETPPPGCLGKDIWQNKPRK